jgi:hypothetical protein
MGEELCGLLGSKRGAELDPTTAALVAQLKVRGF